MKIRFNVKHTINGHLQLDNPLVGTFLPKVHLWILLHAYDRDCCGTTVGSIGTALEHTPIANTYRTALFLRKYVTEIFKYF